MKKLMTILFLLMISFSAFSQEEETLLSGNFTSGGFGGPVVKFTEINKEFGLMVGGYGGWLINHQFMIGGGGYGLTKGLTSPLDSTEVNFGYGGFMLEYAHNPSRLYHFTGSLLIGSGGLGTEKMNRDRNVFFVLEPTLSMEVNVTNYFHIAGGVSYRYVSGIDSFGFSDDDFSNAAITLTFKFGKF